MYYMNREVSTGVSSVRVLVSKRCTVVLLMRFPSNGQSGPGFIGIL